MKRIYSISTRLEMTGELKEYLENYIADYCKLERKMYNDIRYGKIKEYGSISKYVSYICNKYGVLKRTVNSIRYDIGGKIKAYKELKKTELVQICQKINSIKEKINSIENDITLLKSIVTNNNASEKELEKYRNLKKKRYFKKNKLNKLIQKRDNLKKQIEESVIKIGYGTKKAFKKQHNLKENGYKSIEKWKNEYIKLRDQGIFYLGSGDETQGNQMLQLYPCSDGSFTMILRKENKYRESNKILDREIRVTGLKFKYLGDWLANILNTHREPVTYRIHRKGNKWYLIAVFSVDVSCETTTKYGVRGIDYNDGFMEIVETDVYGNIVDIEKINLEYHGTGNKAKSEIEEKLSKVVRRSFNKGKDIVIEDLDFIKKKASVKENKKYNKMIHLFDYSRYKQTIGNLCNKYGVNLIAVNPANTSKIGKKKYAYKRKLSVHQAAAYVIARRGQGFIDELTA